MGSLLCRGIDGAQLLQPAGSGRQPGNFHLRSPNESHQSKGLEGNIRFDRGFEAGAASPRLAGVPDCPTCRGAGMLRTGGGALGRIDAERIGLLEMMIDSAKRQRPFGAKSRGHLTCCNYRSHFRLGFDWSAA
jgi:hypothetical protein